MSVPSDSVDIRDSGNNVQDGIADDSSWRSTSSDEAYDSSWLVDPKEAQERERLKSAHLIRSEQMPDLMTKMLAAEEAKKLTNSSENIATLNVELLVQAFNDLQDAEEARKLLIRMLALPDFNTELIIAHTLHTDGIPLSIAEMLCIVAMTKNVPVANKHTWMRTLWKTLLWANPTILMLMLDEIVLNTDPIPEIVFELVESCSNLPETRASLVRVLQYRRLQTFAWQSVDQTIGFLNACKRLLPESLAVIGTSTPFRRALLTAYITPVIVHNDHDAAADADSVGSLMFEPTYEDASRLILIHGTPRLPEHALDAFKDEFIRRILVLTTGLMKTYTYAHIHMFLSSSSSLCHPFIIVECANADKLLSMFNGYQFDDEHIFFAIPWIRFRPNRRCSIAKFITENLPSAAVAAPSEIQ